MKEMLHKINGRWILDLVVVISVWYLLFWLDTLLIKVMRFPSDVKEFVYLFAHPILYALPFAGLTVFLGRYRWFLLPVYVYLLVIEVLETYLLHAFGSVFTGDLLLIALNSSKEEVLSVARVILSFEMVATALSIVALGLMLGRVAFRGSCRFRRMTRVGLLSLFCLPLALNVVRLHLQDKKQTLPISFDVVVDTFSTYRANAEYWEACRNPAPFGDVSVSFPHKGAAPLGVIVIGESLTRNDMSLYGYGRETTPRMCDMGDELYVFTDLLASWSHTVECLHYLLTEKELHAKHGTLCTFPEVCRRAGYHCVLLSNQGHWGRYDTLDTALFSACAEKTWLREERACRHLYDIDMVEMLASTVRDAPKGPVMVFVHTRGSHYPFVCPASHEKFPPDLTDDSNRTLNAAERKTVNAYDNTVCHADATFEGLVRLVRETRRPSFVVYVSDHGETPRANNRWRVETDRDLWEIPLVIWISKEYAQAYPEMAARLRASVSKRLQEDQLFLGFLSLAQVVGYSRYETTRDFLSPDFRPRERRMIRNGKVAYEKDN